MKPTPVRGPQLVAFSAPLAIALGLDPDALNSAEGAQIFSGSCRPDRSFCGT